MPLELFGYLISAILGGLGTYLAVPAYLSRKDRHRRAAQARQEEAENRPLSDIGLTRRAALLECEQLHTELRGGTEESIRYHATNSFVKSERLANLMNIRDKENAGE